MIFKIFVYYFTSKNLALFIFTKIKKFLKNLNDEEFDDPFGESAGAGAIFGDTG